MKKLIMMVCTMLVMVVLPIAANAASMIFGNVDRVAYNPATGEGTLLSRYTTYSTGVLYYAKCTNSFTSKCNGAYMVVSYTSQTGGSGTVNDPYILTNCSYTTCACEPYEYLQSDDTCASCQAGYGDHDDNYHYNKSCTCSSNEISEKSSNGVVTKCWACDKNGTCKDDNLTCNANYYKSDFHTCTACEDGATSAAGSTKHTACCYPKDKTVDDKIKGKYKIKSKCCYSE